MKKKILIGVDTGVNTGFAVYNLTDKVFERIDTVMLHEAIIDVLSYQSDSNVEIVKIRVEDARKRTWFGNADQRMERSGAGIREGIGSVKRDAKVWEDFLTDFNIPFELVKPIKKATKWKAEQFKNSFGWSGKTSEHSRDAALLIVQ